MRRQTRQLASDKLFASRDWNVSLTNKDNTSLREQLNLNVRLARQSNNPIIKHQVNHWLARTTMEQKNTL